MSKRPAPQLTPKPIPPRDWMLIILLGAIWGGSFFFAKIAVAEMNPLVLVMFRVSIAALVLHIWLRWMGISFRPAVPMAGSFLILALLNNIVPFSLIFMGQTELGAGLAAVLNATTPFWTAVVASIFTTDEKLSAVKLIGIFFGIAGVAVMIGPGLQVGLGGPVWAKLALISAALSYAFAFVYGRRFRGMAPPVVATGQLTVSALVMVPFAALFHDVDQLFLISRSVWLAVLALAVLATAMAYILYFHILASVGATNTSLVTFIVPVSAIVLGALFLNERLEPSELIGMALIALGLASIDGRVFSVSRRWLRRSRTSI